MDVGGRTLLKKEGKIKKNTKQNVIMLLIRKITTMTPMVLIRYAGH